VNNLIILGSDHAGYEMKQKIKEFLKSQNYKCVDVSEEYVEADDYTDIVESICKLMKFEDKAIMVCGTGIGSAIVANKYKGIRAAICYDEYTARLTRYDNDANMLCLGGRTVLAEDDEKLITIVKTFLDTEFSGEERHIRRLKKIEEVEKRRE
jgi:ribose 5-phosphate isomerase B